MTLKGVTEERMGAATEESTAPYVVAVKVWEQQQRRGMTAEETAAFHKAWGAFCEGRRKGKVSVPELTADDARSFGMRWRPEARTRT